ncbi:hypothetical protein ABEB36_000079 [Hypothenemus hampei]|uniref:THAP-type domain-containing protein n=1 Tax=Hypothenemus hampei TaxID=57062 RepID=A0ABD1FA78_HYPHA
MFIFLEFNFKIQKVIKLEEILRLFFVILYLKLVAIYCAVEGCWASKESKHTFPNPPKNMELFKKWLQFCNNERLLEVTPDKIFRNSRVCRLHFEATDFMANNHLKRPAYPKICGPVAMNVLFGRLSFIRKVVQLSQVVLMTAFVALPAK